MKKILIMLAVVLTLVPLKVALAEQYCNRSVSADGKLAYICSDIAGGGVGIFSTPPAGALDQATGKPFVTQTATTPASSASTGSLPNGITEHTTGGDTIGGAAGAAAGGLASKAGGKAGCAAAGVAVGAGAQAAAQAQDANAVPVISHSANTINTITAKSTAALETKECILDGLIVSIREALIAAITQSIIDWINNGFEGAPAFITNLSSFLGQIADSISLNFIQGSELGFLCSPFQLQVRLALSVAQRPFIQRAQCSLGDVTRNIEGFLGGDFSQGGFPALFKISIDEQNNPYVAYVNSKNELDIRIAAGEQKELLKVQWGNGARDHGKCEGGVGNNVVPPTTEAECEAIGGHWKTDTWGSIINHQINETLGSGQRQLELADEIDEIISALLAQLAQKALTAIGGLSGLSSRSSGSSSNGQSYLDQLTQAAGADATASAHDVLVMQATGAISLESSVQSAINATNSILTEEKALLTARYQCYTNVNNLSAATTASSTTATINSKLNTNRAIIIAAASAINTLIDIVAQADSAETADEVNAAGNRYDALVQSGSLHTAADLTTYELARDAEQSALDTLKAQTGDSCLTQTTQ